MDIIWKEKDVSAKRIAKIAKEQIGWSKTTTYTVIKKCIDKGVIKRQEPNFICRALVTREEVRQFETNELINRMYDGLTDQLIASIFGSKKLMPQEIERLKQFVNQLD